MGRRVRGEGGEVCQLLVQQNKANLKSEGPTWTENHDMQHVRIPNQDIPGWASNAEATGGKLGGGPMISGLAPLSNKQNEAGGARTLRLENMSTYFPAGSRSKEIPYYRTSATGLGNLKKQTKMPGYTLSHGKEEGADKRLRQTAKREQRGAGASEDEKRNHAAIAGC